MPAQLDIGGALRKHLVEPVEWHDAENALESAADALRELACNGSLQSDVLAAIERGAIPARKGDRGVYWFDLASSPELDTTLRLRFCPSGSVAPAHEHLSPLLARVMSGMYKQVLLGVGGGVRSSEDDIPLYVRHEHPGQTFALMPGQRHSTSSTAGLVLLVLTPHDAAAPPGETSRAAPGLIRKLRGAMRAAL